jgi:hypothetical protein
MKPGSHLIVMKPEFPGAKSNGSVTIGPRFHGYPITKFELRMETMCEHDVSWTNKESEWPKFSKVRSLTMFQRVTGYAHEAARTT